LPGAKPEEPQLKVEQVSQRPAVVPGTWIVTWRIENESPEPVDLRECYAPHGKFFGQSVDLSGRGRLDPSAGSEIQLPVVFEETPGATVENAFLILTAVWQERVLRIFVRMTVASDSNGAPAAKTELITMQEVGFSREKL
jgi:hypothetical protein